MEWKILKKYQKFFDISSKYAFQIYPFLKKNNFEYIWRETFLDENDHGYDDASVKKFQWDLNEDSSSRVGCNIRLNLARNA